MAIPYEARTLAAIATAMFRALFFPVRIAVEIVAFPWLREH